MTKTCFKCGEEKTLQEFYVHSQMADGHLNKCKDCAKKDSISNRTKNIEKYTQYDKRRAGLKHRVEARRLYQLTELGKSASRRARAKYEERNPEKREAHIRVNNALKGGVLKRETCEVCGSRRVHAHHDDYTRPLEVRWLCPKHHSELHQGLAQV